MEKVHKKSLGRITAEKLRSLIIKGELKVGDKIDPDAICTRIGVSKTPLREAFQVLRLEGLIKIVPNRGAFVAKPSIATIRELFEVLSVLEGLSARKAAANISEKDLLGLEKLFNRMELEYERREEGKYNFFNEQFHNVIRQLSGNQSLIQAIKTIRRQISVFQHWGGDVNYPLRLEQAMQDHREIMEAFKEKNSDEAERRMKKHMEVQFNAMMDFLIPIGTEKKQTI